MKGQSGITLVALVITVIVMLILAGVALSVLVDGEGLFTRTKDAADTYNTAADNENKTVDNLMNYIDEQIWIQNNS